MPTGRPRSEKPSARRPGAAGAAPVPAPVERRADPCGVHQAPSSGAVAFRRASRIDVFRGAGTAYDDRLDAAVACSSAASVPMLAGPRCPISRQVQLAYPRAGEPTGGSPCARFACWPGPGHDRRAFPRPLATRCKYTTLGPGRRRHARHGGGQTASANAVLVFQPSVGSEDGVGSFAGVDGAVAALVGPVGDLAGEAGGFGGAAFVVGDSG